MAASSLSPGGLLCDVLATDSRINCLLSGTPVEGEGWLSGEPYASLGQPDPTRFGATDARAPHPENSYEFELQTFICTPPTVT